MRKEIRFGRNLRILRSKKEISQQEVANAIHVTRQTLSAWEKGSGKPDIYCVHEICNFFDVPIEKMVYGNILGENISLTYEEEYGFYYKIKNYNKSGLYSVTDEDLDEFFEMLKYDLEHISVTALALNKRGYMITEVFGNGFSVYLRSEDEAIKFQKDLYNILDSFIHGDDSYIEERIKKIKEITIAASNAVLDLTMKEILGADINEFPFYWVDEIGNIRGYAKSEKE